MTARKPETMTLRDRLLEPDVVGEEVIRYAWPMEWHTLDQIRTRWPSPRVQPACPETELSNWKQRA